MDGGASAARKALRGEMRTRLVAVDRDGARRAGEAAAAMLFESPVWHRATSVLLYAAVGGEVNTAAMARAAWAAGKRVALPRPLVDELDLAPAWWDEHAALAAGPYGIPIPALGQPAPDVDLVMVPGLAFDLAGRRIGRGLGYYDRWLPNHPNAIRIGVGHPWQVVRRVPVEAHDVPVQWVLTPKSLTDADLDTAGGEP